MVEESEESVPSFHSRFNIQIGSEETQRRFINRVINKVGQDLAGLVESKAYHPYRNALLHAASRLGVEYDSTDTFYQYVSSGYSECLVVLEALCESFAETSPYTDLSRRVVDVIEYAISLSETDLGIEWRDGAFWPSGAGLMDEALVNENLKWLSDKGYNDVVTPFEKGLRHFVEAVEKPERLGDAVTDVYEAVEALAKVVTGKDDDLSGNAELFISKLKLSEYWKDSLKRYVEHACDYRHAPKLAKKRPALNRNEVEAFIYTSGLFIRLAIQQLT